MPLQKVAAAAGAARDPDSTRITRDRQSENGYGKMFPFQNPFPHIFRSVENVYTTAELRGRWALVRIRCIPQPVSATAGCCYEQPRNQPATNRKLPALVWPVRSNCRGARMHALTGRHCFSGNY